MPGHFVLKVEDISPSLFVDCFNEGVFLDEQDCKNILIQSGFGYQADYLGKKSKPFNFVSNVAKSHWDVSKTERAWPSRTFTLTYIHPRRQSKPDVTPQVPE